MSEIAKYLIRHAKDSYQVSVWQEQKFPVIFRVEVHRESIPGSLTGRSYKFPEFLAELSDKERQLLQLKLAKFIERFCSTYDVNELPYERLPRAWESDNRMLMDFARHIVGLSYFDRSRERAADNDGVGHFVMLTGFVVSIRGVWHWLTAGHILEDLEKAMKNGQRLEQFEWHDSFGRGAKDSHTVKTTFSELPKLDICDRGMDYGIVKLTQYIVEHFKANRIEAMSEEFYEGPWPETFDRYMLLGFPSQLNHKVSRIGSDHAYVDRSLALLGVNKIDDPPKFLQQGFLRFYGKVALIEIPIDGKTVTDIDGMSGGVIFGIKKDNEGNNDYWLYAVQSGWDKDSRTIAACPIQPFVQEFAHRIDSLIEHQPTH